MAGSSESHAKVNSVYRLQSKLIFPFPVFPQHLFCLPRPYFSFYVVLSVFLYSDVRTMGILSLPHNCLPPTPPRQQTGICWLDDGKEERKASKAMVHYQILAILKHTDDYEFTHSIN